MGLGVSGARGDVVMGLGAMGQWGSGYGAGGNGAGGYGAGSVPPTLFTRAVTPGPGPAPADPIVVGSLCPVPPPGPAAAPALPARPGDDLWGRRLLPGQMGLRQLPGGARPHLGLCGAAPSPLSPVGAAGGGDTALKGFGGP